MNDDRKSSKLFIFPRNYLIQTQYQPGKITSLRLFFTRKELEETLQNFREKTGIIYSINDILVLQSNEKAPDTDPANNSFQKGSYTFIKPQWFNYGANSSIIVAEFPVSTLRSEFYLSIRTSDPL